MGSSGPSGAAQAWAQVVHVLWEPSVSQVKEKVLSNTTPTTGHEAYLLAQLVDAKVGEPESSETAAWSNLAEGILISLDGWAENLERWKHRLRAERLKGTPHIGVTGWDKDLDRWHPRSAGWLAAVESLLYAANNVGLVEDEVAASAVALVCWSVDSGDDTTRDRVGHLIRSSSLPFREGNAGPLQQFVHLVSQWLLTDDLGERSIIVEQCSALQRGFTRPVPFGRIAIMLMAGELVPSDVQR